MESNEKLAAALKAIRSGSQPPIMVFDQHRVEVYPSSVRLLGESHYFLGRENGTKYLYLVSSDSAASNSLFGDVLAPTVKRCPLVHDNAVRMQELFSFTKPKLIGIDDSYGLGCRLGLANPGHLRAIRGSGVKPVLAQQSIRELERTGRQAEEVMDAAVWAVFQEGYTDGFGSDADHLKTPQDIDRMVTAGFTMFTFDPSEYVVNEADSLSVAALEERAKKIEWGDLGDSFDAFIARYVDRSFDITEGFSIRVDRESVLRGLIKYGSALAHIKRLHTYFLKSYPDYPFELEISVDETDSVTSPFEHLLVALELRRLKVPIVSLAPRFVGDFEKGIDYKGDLETFRREYGKHVQISDKYGPYKISVHSGSDKFSVYAVIGSLREGHVHVKTAGTSYLEALRAIARAEPKLFREILDFSRGLYETEKRTYHVSADLRKVHPANDYADSELESLFDSDDARQVLHVTFGKVLTTRNNDGEYLFRQRILDCLNQNEELYAELIEKHFRRHIEPFKARS